MSHLNYTGTMEFDICTTLNSRELYINLKGILEELNDKDNFDGSIGEITFNKFSLCNCNDCLKVDMNNEEE